MGNMRKLFLLLCLIIAGVQSAWAQTFVKTYQYNNLTFDLYSDALYFSVAVLKEINGQETDVTVPAYIENEGRTYYVRCGEGTITNNYVKTLIFNGSYDFNYHMGTNSSNVYMSSGLSCSQLTNITFNTVTFYYGGISYLLNLNCPLLTDISFIGNVPTFPEFELYGTSFPPYWSKICSARGENVTAHVKNWTQAECDQNHQNAYVWKDFAAVVPYSETPQTVNVNASVSDGGALQISGQSALTNGSQTYEVEKGSDFTFYAYPSSTNCQVAHVYVNGTDVIGQMTTQSDGKLKYTITNLQDNVTISVVGASYTNQTFVRLGGNGTASFTTKHEGQTKSYNIPANGVVTAPLYEFDSGGFIRFVVTTSGEETVEIFRNGINVTSIFEKSGTTYTFETDDWEANDLWFAFVENVLDEAIWTIKYTDQRQFITFKDAAVKTICLANWDTNGDGKLTMAEAAAVTSLNANGSSSSVFYNNTEITSFTELQYFTGLTSLKSAFYGCSALEEVVVPNGVTNLNSAFGECLALKTVVVPETVTNIERAFGLVINSENISSLEHVILPSGLETIGQYAFVKSGLKSIDIPENVTTIGTYAFHSCVNLKTLYIPSSVTSIKGFIPDMGNSLSFHNCTGLESIAVDAQNNNYKSPNGCNAIIEKSSNKLILGCRNTVIPDGVVRLGGYSFYKQPITSVVIPESVTAIEASCFYNCADLAMVECKSETPPSIASTSFSGISADAVLKVPHGCTEAYKAAGWKTQDEDGVFKQIVEDGPELGPDLKVTLAIGGGCKYYIGMTYNGNFSERGGEGGEILSIEPFKKEKIGDNFYLKLIPHPGRYIAGVKANSVTLSKLESHGDTAIYDLSHLKTLTDSVVISAICKDRADYTKRIVRIKTKGVGENFGVCLVRDLTHSELVCQFGPSDLPLDRTDTLDVNTQYQIQFAGARNINLKRVTINGEEVEVTGDVTKVTPKRTLQSFDENIIIEFEGADDLERYDVNRDNKVDISDVTKLVNKVLNR